MAQGGVPSDRAARVDPSVPNVARVWNYLVGGRDNFEADRQAARQLVAASPVMEQVGARVAGVPPPGGHLPGGRGGGQAVPRHRHGHADGGQHARGGPGGGPVLPHRLRRQRPRRALARARQAALVGRGRDQLPRRGRQGHQAPSSPGRRETLDFARPVGVIMIDILNFLEDAGDVLARLAAAVPRAATWPSCSRRGTSGWPWPRAGGTSWRRSRSSCATAPRSSAGSPALSSSTPASSRCTSGGPAPGDPDVPGRHAAPGCGGQEALTDNVGPRGRISDRDQGTCG